MTKVLIVDDSMLSRKITSTALTDAGFEVVTAVNGADGLEVFEKHQPDCVISDLLMPVMNGFEFIRQLRKTDKNVPVFVISSDIQASSKQECEEIGISGFLNKPILGSHVVSCLNKALHGTPSQVTS